MNTVKSAFLLICTLAIMAFAGWYIASSSPAIRLDDKLLAQSPDIIATNLTIRRFNEQGMLVDYIKAPEMQHIPAQDCHFFKTPRIAVWQPDHSVWHIMADKAKAVHGGEKIIFLHHIVMEQKKIGDAITNGQNGVMKTEKLIYLPKQKLAFSDRAVSFSQPGTIVHAVGMRADLATKKVELLSRTHATYLPQHG